MNKNIIAHLADIHIRLNSRFDEYKSVLERTIDELKEIKPRRIVIAGDLFHIKINMTPKSTSIAGWFIQELSKISPVDIILGNHDMNEKIKAQGNTIEPLIELMNNGFVMSKKDANSKINYYKSGDYYGIYFYKDSGLYEVEDDIVYGVYSMWDNELIQLNVKEPGKKYIALYHNPIYGCKMDNGMENKRDDLLRITEFSNYDIVMLGDIHKYQSFKRKNHLIENGKFVEREVDSAAYSSSLIQQHFGESIDKGFIIWDIEKFTHKRIIVPNDYGFCKLRIKYGEDIEEKIKDLYFSADKKKTKVFIEYEEKEENFSEERERQTIMKIKKLHGCEIVTMDCVFIKENKNTGTIEEANDAQIEDDFETILVKWLEENGMLDCKSDVVDLSREIDKELSFIDKKTKRMDWEINSLEINNLFSFADESVIINFDKLDGVTGIFGDNYSGKSNVVRALIWVLYGKILGDGENYEAINIYSKSNIGYGDLFITIDGTQYRIYRQIKMNKSKKTEKITCTYEVKFQYIKDGEWKDAEQEIGATEQNDSKKLIEETIGDFDDFTKVCLQTQGGKFDYLALSQQPKNDLINKYVGLEIFRHRYDLANIRFKEIKNVQKHLGNVEEINREVLELETNNDLMNASVQNQEIEKKGNLSENDLINNKIIELSKQIIPIKNIVNLTEDQIFNKLCLLDFDLQKKDEQIKVIESWLESNSKKDIPVDNPSDYNKSIIERKINDSKLKFETDKKNYINIENWIKENPRKEEVDTTDLENKVQEYKLAIKELEHKRDVAKGKKCPTCGNEEQKADPILEKQCEERIVKGNESVNKLLGQINSYKSNIKHNNSYDKQVNSLSSLKNGLISLQAELKDLKSKFDLSDTISEIISHNNEVDKKTKEVKALYKEIVDGELSINELKNKRQILAENKSSIENNSILEKEIINLKEEQKTYKLAVYNLENSIRDLSGKIMVNVSQINTLKSRADSIKRAETDYKKYSVYLQAVHRDGIPSQIIRRKIPIINSKINNIVSKIANFKVELAIRESGDIREYFYYNEDKSDKLSLSMGSGSQKFISTVAIRDALHFVSSLTKPSFCAIDEGFDTLDSEKKQSIIDVLEYLKSKYKNVVIITHLPDIKDIVEHEIQTHRNEYEVNGEIKWNTKINVR
jgi:DNA repair exonuclease SbcCD ATPase subunit/predicted MPP superfamily phosphohydrolase